jgi:Ca-dependent carbohydrate-binding module xylan-binding
VRRLVLFLSVAVSALVVAATALVHGAGAAPASPFTVVNGSIRAATGTPVPPSGTHASLWSNTSTATTTLDGSGRVVLGAIGDDCDGWPTVRVTVDGAVVGSTTIVDAHRYGQYPVGKAVGAGRHAVVIAFVNDYRDTSCDRNVSVGFAAMESAGPTPAPSPTSTSPAPAPGRPGPGNTGVPAGTPLTVHQGDLVVRTDGAVIDSMDIHGFLKIQADNVTVRRSLIRGGHDTGVGTALVQMWSGKSGIVLEDDTVRADFPSGWLNGIHGYGYTARRLNVSNVVDSSVVFGNDVTITDSWFHDLSYFSPWPLQSDNQTHNDNLQIEGGSNILVQHNVFEGAHNAAIMVTQNVTRTSGVRVTGNWLSGGGCTVNLSEKGKGPILGFRLSGNRFGPSLQANCAVIAPPTTDVTLDGDVWDATGLPVTIRRN